VQSSKKRNKVQSKVVPFPGRGKMKTKLGGELIVRDAGIELFGPRIASNELLQS
jgi:hypothetical protein